MKSFDVFLKEAEAKKCPDGEYWCYTDKKCKKIPRGYHVGYRGYLEPDDDNKKNGKGNGNGNGDPVPTDAGGLPSREYITTTFDLDGKNANSPAAILRPSCEANITDN